MQAVTVSHLRDFSDEFTEVSENFENDFIFKLKINDENVEIENEDNHNEEEVEEEEEKEFSFIFADPNGSPISADDAFDNGKIRPIFPIFGQNLLFTDDFDSESGPRSPVKRIFVQQKDDPSSSSSAASTPAVDGPCCEWTPKTPVKSNSTGSSKIWKCRDAKLRSNSDGKDAFVFLNHPQAVVKSEKVNSGETKNVVVKKVKVVKGKTTSSAHEKHYVMNKARKESDKRKSYLPYRQELFGFFASTNVMSRNVHPY